YINHQAEIIEWRICRICDALFHKIAEISRVYANFLRNLGYNPIEDGNVRGGWIHGRYIKHFVNYDDYEVYIDLGCVLKLLFHYKCVKKVPKNGCFLLE
ncbi:MAG: hypothetical protein LBC93_03755, partial [Synergistaceae bacterium]|nr:hypothetical protein [Synergistaceae bacterium]